uniref:Uncharacterized protein n=1 Tax=Arundo donax TaxID=35708 RepID=A0A0A9E079_ARUDO
MPLCDDSPIARVSLQQYSTEPPTPNQQQDSGHHQSTEHRGKERWI